jgi:autoinducer 2-degrading protein
MIVIAVDVQVKPDKVEAFKQATLANARGARSESGNLRFDVSQGVDDPGHFMLYEAYRDEEAIKAHQQSAHYLAWRASVEDWMARPRRRTRFDSLFPEGPQDW